MAVSKAEQLERDMRRASPLGRIKLLSRVLGPGLITGASDDDPSGIGTFVQSGAQFGTAHLWTALFTFPLMTVIQEMCARIALSTGTGLAVVIRKHYPRPILYFCLALLVIANTANIGADLGAMAASGQTLLGLPFLVWLAVIAAATLAAMIFFDYAHYARILRFLTLTLLVYVLVVLVVKQNWGQALHDTIVPTVRFDRDYLMFLVAILGTTISPYLFFWQASEEIEEEKSEGKMTVPERRGTTKTELKWMRADVIAGMLLSNVVTWFILLTTASTLFRNGIHQVDSVTKAAEALKPIAGPFAALLFSAGIIGTGALAVPVLAGSAAYAVGDTFKFPRGLSLKWHQAPLFYGVIVFSTLIGAAINLLGINPIVALYYSSVLNGLAAPPLLFMLMLITNNRKIMQEHVNGRLSNILGWVTTLAMTVAAAALLLTIGQGQ